MIAVAGAVTAASFGDVFASIAGVILALTGLAISFMGLAAISERVLKRGTVALAFGLGFLAVGLWLVGALG